MQGTDYLDYIPFPCEKKEREGQVSKDDGESLTTPTNQDEITPPTQSRYPPIVKRVLFSGMTRQLLNYQPVPVHVYVN